MSASGAPDVEVFEGERPRLTGLAYRMLGSITDAEDVVSEAWLRYQRVGPATLDRPEAWLTTVTSRLAIDRLRTIARRREEYVGPWLPEPVPGVGGVGCTGLSVTPDSAEDPAERAALSESLTLGFLVVLDRLGPIERAVFLLADVFGEPYAQIADAVGRSEDACRQIASRARRRVREERSGRVAADEALLAELVSALVLGDVDAVLGLLSPSVVLTSDGGPDRHAARRPVIGPDRVARLLINLARRTPGDADIQIETVNAAPAVVVRHPEVPVVVAADRDAEGQVVTVRLLLNPDKLVGLDAPFQGI